MKSAGLEKLEKEEILRKEKWKNSKKNNFKIRKVMGDPKKKLQLNTIAISLHSTSLRPPFPPTPTIPSGYPLNPSSD